MALITSDCGTAVFAAVKRVVAALAAARSVGLGGRQGESGGC